MVSIRLVVGVCRLGVDRITLGFFEGWISKYPMIHAKGFLVLLLFSGLPDSSACLSASEERNMETTNEAGFSTYTTHIAETRGASGKQGKIFIIRFLRNFLLGLRKPFPVPVPN